MGFPIKFLVIMEESGFFVYSNDRTIDRADRIPIKTSRKLQNEIKKTSSYASLNMVPKAGIEPARCCHHGILSPARLPVPSLRLT